MKALHDRRGAVYFETLVAFLPVLLLFVASLQLADLSVAHLTVQHASTTAARAAVVVLPDDGAYYGDADNATVHQFVGLRKADVEQAADLILRTHGRIVRGGDNVSLDKTAYAQRDDLTATVRAQFQCLIPALCGGSIALNGESKLVYQGARYIYEPTEAGDFGGRPQRDPPPAGDAPPAGGDGRPPAGDGPPVADGRDPGGNPPGDGRGRTPAADAPGDARGRDPTPPRDGPRDPVNTPDERVASNEPPRGRDDGRVAANAPPGSPSNGADRGRESPAGRPGIDPTKPGERGPASAGSGRGDRGNEGSVAANPPGQQASPGSAGRADPPLRGDLPGAVATAPDGRRPAAPTVPQAPGGSKLPEAPGQASAGLEQNGSRGPPNGSDGRPIDLTKPDGVGRPVEVAAITPGRSADSGQCGSGGCTIPGSCFAAGTLVHAEAGLRPIELLQPGERVWSRDEATRTVGLRPILRRFVTSERPLFQVEIEGAAVGVETLHATAEHPFYTKRGWVATQALRRGDHILVRANAWRAVHDVQRTARVETVYNFEVDEFHTYFVGAAGVWVHNSCETLANELTKNDLFTKAQARRISEDARAARITNEVERLVEHAHQGRLANPQEIEELVKRTARSDRGLRAHQEFLQEINDALDRMDRGHRVELGGGADVVDHTAREAIQHKLIGAERQRQTRDDSDEPLARQAEFGKLRDNLAKALKQLTGENGETPPDGYRHVVDIRVARNKSSKLSRADGAELQRYLDEIMRLSRESTSTNPDDALSPIQNGAEVRITNQNGTYVFRAVGTPGRDQRFALISSPD